MVGKTVLAAASVGVVLLGGLLAADTPGTASADAAVARQPAAAPNELVGLLDHGRNQTFHATYRAVSTEVGAQGQSVTVELWQKPPRKRQDLVLTAQDRTGRTSAFHLPGRSVACQQVDQGAWTCANADGSAATGADALIAQITAAGVPSAGRDETINGVPVRCFDLAVAGGVAQVCVTRTGVPARISSGPSRFELAELGSEVPDSVFEPPQ